MSIITTDTFQAMATVSAGGATFLAGSKAPGFSSVSNGGAGLNNLAVEQPVDETQCVIQATPRSTTADVSCQTNHVSDNVKQVRTYLAGVLSDLVAFDVVLFRLPNT